MEVDNVVDDVVTIPASSIRSERSDSADDPDSDDDGGPGSVPWDRAENRGEIVILAQLVNKRPLPFVDGIPNLPPCAFPLRCSGHRCGRKNMYFQRCLALES
jgi:hypothetical protein